MINGRARTMQSIQQEKTNELIEDIQNETYGHTQREESIHTKLRSKISLADELKIHRKAITLLFNRLGITSYEFEELCQEIIKAKNETDENINNINETEELPL